MANPHINIKHPIGGSTSTTPSVRCRRDEPYQLMKSATAAVSDKGVTLVDDGVFASGEFLPHDLQPNIISAGNLIEAKVICLCNSCWSKNKHVAAQNLQLLCLRTVQDHTQFNGCPFYISSQPRGYRNRGKTYITTTNGMTLQELVTAGILVLLSRSHPPALVLPVLQVPSGKIIWAFTAVGSSLLLLNL